MNNTTTTSKFTLARRMTAWWRQRREARARAGLLVRCPPATVAAAQVPAAVRAAWVAAAPEAFPGLRVDDASWLRCTLALAQFFEACRLQRAHGACALPSKGGDSVWHAWLQQDPSGLTRWQRAYFDHEVEHHEAESLGAPLDECLARTWVGACRSEGLNPLGPRLPLVFALDGLLALPTGWAYRFERSGLVHRDIDGFGRTGGAGLLHASVAGAGLVGLGLLSEPELQALRRQQVGGNGGDGGSGWVSSDGAATGGGNCDGGSASCSSGSSCGGSSCGGGGCGGGG